MSSKGLSNMKASKKGLERACSHGQHVLDKHEQDIRHMATNKTRLGQSSWPWHHDTQLTNNYPSKLSMNPHLDDVILMSILPIWCSAYYIHYVCIRMCFGLWAVFPNILLINCLLIWCLIFSWSSRLCMLWMRWFRSSSL